MVWNTTCKTSKKNIKERDVSVIQPPFSQSDVKWASLVLIQPMKAFWRIQGSIKKNFQFTPTPNIGNVHSSIHSHKKSMQK